MKNKVIKLELEKEAYNLEISRYGIGLAMNFGLEDFLIHGKINPVTLPYALFYAFLEKHHSIDFQTSVEILDMILNEYGETLYNELVDEMQNQVLEYFKIMEEESKKEKKKGKIAVI